MKKKHTFLIILLLSIFLWADEIDAEILNNLDFFMEMETVEQFEDIQELSDDEKTTNEFVEALKGDRI